MLQSVNLSTNLWELNFIKLPFWKSFRLKKTFFFSKNIHSKMFQIFEKQAIAYEVVT